MTRRHVATSAWATVALVVIGLSACQDTPPLLAPVTSGPATPVAPAGSLQIALDCRADVAARTMTCGPTPGATPVLPAGISAALIIGGQNTYLTLAQIGTSYDAANGVLASAITVKNLISQPLGTADGITLDPNGVRVFFHTLPFVTGGTGTVTVRNADGTGVFTASGQPYFVYQEIITGNATSAAKTWTFNLPTSVTAFTFQVYVQATLRNESTPLTQPAHAFSGQLVAGNAATCAIRTAAGVYCWGANQNGTVGVVPGQLTYRPYSVAVGPQLASIASGASSNHNCGLTVAGAAYCWGYNNLGQLGDGTPTQRPTPTAVMMPSGDTFTSLVTGTYDTCALTPAGAAYCWGYNSNGQLGDGTTNTHYLPTAVRMPTGVTFTSLVSGAYHVCGLTSAGAAYCWGYNFSGHLGDGTTVSRTTPTAVTMPNGVTFGSLAAGVNHTCGVTPGGAAYCWGENILGQLGDGTATDRSTPTPVAMPNGVTFITLSGGEYHSCGLAATGTAYCWGYNGEGQLGDGTVMDHSLPAAAPSGVTFASVLTGGRHTCGLTSAGQAYCWGSNAAGRLGDATATNRSTPTAVSMPIGATFGTLALGGSHTCGLTPAGAVYCWGETFNGQLGNLNSLSTSFAAPVLAVNTYDLTQIAMGPSAQHVCGVTSVGAAYCWGLNSNGQLGDGTGTTRFTATAVALPVGVTFASVGEGTSHTCGLTSAGEAYCWGNNGNGQLGDGSTVSHSVPTAVTMPGGVTFSSIAGGATQTCALTSTGAAYCWGAGTSSQLGNGSATQRTTPTAVTMPGGVTFARLTAGTSFTCALATGGTTYCWGLNSSNQLGDSTTFTRSIPTAVKMPNGVAFASIASGATHTCGLTAAGATYCWGINNGGQLGDGTQTRRAMPTAVSGGVALVSLAGGANHTCGMTSVGTVYCWGSNGSGRLGDGTQSQRFVPTLTLTP